jgi:membrane-associated phospholipid phosphatase
MIWRPPQFRRSELFFSAYFIYVAILALARPIAPEIRALTVTTNLAILLWFFLFAWAHRDRGFHTLDRVRDIYPLPLLLLAYRQMNWIALPQGEPRFEPGWLEWDVRLLVDWHGTALVESLGPLLPNVLELAYMLTYGLPVLGLVAVTLAGARRRVDDFFSILLFGTLTAYAFYPWFPSTTPRTLYPDVAPAMDTLLRRANLAILGQYAITASVFPSGHTACAFSAAFGLLRVLPQRRRHGYAVLTLAILIAIATVYGRYHYAVDTLAGLAMALLALGYSFTWRESRASSSNS